MQAVIIGLFYGLKNISAQVFFWRLFYLTFSSSELSLGIILGAWFITNLSGLLFGQRLIRWKFAEKIFPLIFWLELAGFYLGVYLLANGRSFFSLLPGQIFDLPETIILTTVALFFLNFFSGLEFVFLTAHFSPPQNIYRGELLGFLFGGIGTTYFLFPLTQRYFLYFLYSFSLAILIFLSIRRKWRLFALGIFLFLFFSPVQLYQKIERKNIANISRQIDTPYQNIKITTDNSQIIVYQNNQPTLALPATITAHNELTTILAHLAQPKSTDWLVIGNYPDLAAVSNQVPGLKIIWWEKDKNFARLIRQYLDPTRFQFISEPLENYPSSGQKFSTILIYGISPQTFAQNYFFQKNFFLLLHKFLTPDGIVLIDLVGSETYLTFELKQFNASVFQTLKSVFPNVLAIPGEHTFLIASSKPIPAGTSLLNIYPKNFAAKIITKKYLSYYLAEDRLKKFELELKKTKVTLNQKLNPSAVFYYLSYLRSYSKGKNYFFLILGSGFFILIMLIFWYRRRNPARNILLSLGTTGFSIFLFYWIVLALFQMRCGYLYQWLGLFSAIFMLGNFLGTHLKFLTGKKLQTYFWMDIATTAFLFVATIILLFSADNNYTFLVLTLGSGLLVGWQFLWTTKQISSDQRIVNAAYTADILGSALAGLASGFLFFLPVSLEAVLIFLIIVKLLNNLILVSERS